MRLTANNLTIIFEAREDLFVEHSPFQKKKMNNHLHSFRKSQVRWAAVSSDVFSFLSSPFCGLKVSSLAFVHSWRVWKTRNVVESQKALVCHAVAMETEVHTRNWSFVIAPSSTVITNLSRKATSALTSFMLFTIKRANAIQTLLDMIAASASLVTTAETAPRKKPRLAKISTSCLPRIRIWIHEVHQHVQVRLHMRLCGDFDTIWRDQQLKPSWPNARPNSTLSQHQQLWLVRVNALLCCTRHHYPT